MTLMMRPMNAAADRRSMIILPVLVTGMSADETLDRIHRDGSDDMIAQVLRYFENKVTFTIIDRFVGNAQVPCQYRG